jgi:hypothetical protein
MRFHLPKPLHGWREFAGEVGIIVIGVLIALGAQQVVERLSWDRTTTDAKRDLRAELESDLFNTRERVLVKPCIDRRLDQLSDLIDHPPSQPWKLLPGHYLAPIRIWPSSAWDTAIADGAADHMQSDERTNFATAYSFVNILHSIALEEFPVGAEFRMLEHGGRLSEASQDRLRADVARMRGYNQALALGGEQASKKIEALGVQLTADDQRELASAKCPMPADTLPRAPRV